MGRFLFLVHSILPTTPFFPLNRMYISIITISIAAICVNWQPVLSVPAFDDDHMTVFREEVVALIVGEQAGHVFGSPTVGPFDGLIPGEMPLLPTLIRLAFHDCSGFKEGHYPGNPHGNPV